MREGYSLELAAHTVDEEGGALAREHHEPLVPRRQNRGRLQYGMVGYGLAWHGMAWHGMAWHCMVWRGMVWYGMRESSTNFSSQAVRIESACV